MQVISRTVIVPPGKYFLGDPCYSLSQDQWDAVLGSSDYFNQPVGKADGHEVLGFSTAYGDGEYQDQYGNFFPVDAGLIGLVPEALIVLKGGSPVGYRRSLGIWVEFTTPTTCNNDDGVLTFGKHRINTKDEGETT